MSDVLQAHNSGPATVPFSRRFKLRSHRVGADFTVDVALPAPYLPGGAPWPILFVRRSVLTVSAPVRTPIRHGPGR